INFSETYEDVKAIVENDETKAFSKQVVFDAVTLIKGQTIKLAKKALVIATLPTATSIADEDSHNSKLGLRLKQEFSQLDVVETKVQPTESDIEKLVLKAKDYDQIIYTSYNGNVYQTQIHLIDALAKLDKDLHVLALRNPYDLYYTKQIKNYVAFYEYT